MQKIVPHLWFDTEAVEAAEFYTSIFPDSKLTHRSLIKDTPSGNNDIVGFNIMGFEFRAISAGPYFKMNPSISFTVNFDPADNKDAQKNLDDLWDELSEEGKVLMPLQEYFWSKRYGWIQDKYGVSWQVIPAILDEMMEKGTAKQINKITQTFLKMKKFDIQKLIEAYGDNEKY